MSVGLVLSRHQPSPIENPPRNPGLETCNSRWLTLQDELSNLSSLKYLLTLIFKFIFYPQQWTRNVKLISQEIITKIENKKWIIQTNLNVFFSTDMQSTLWKHLDNRNINWNKMEFASFSFWQYLKSILINDFSLTSLEYRIKTLKKSKRHFIKQ